MVVYTQTIHYLLTTICPRGSDVKQVQAIVGKRLYLHPDSLTTTYQGHSYDYNALWSGSGRR
jgi:hypothetical protein